MRACLEMLHVHAAREGMHARVLVPLGFVKAWPPVKTRSALRNKWSSRSRREGGAPLERREFVHAVVDGQERPQMMT